MEMLSEQTLWGEFIFVVALCSIVTLFWLCVTIGGLTTYIKEKREKLDLVFTILAGIVTVVMVLISVHTLSYGPGVEYKAIVTDYNEVYDAGYEVVKTEGKIVTLKKE